MQCAARPRSSIPRARARSPGESHVFLATRANREGGRSFFARSITRGEMAERVHCVLGAELWKVVRLFFPCLWGAKAKRRESAEGESPGSYNFWVIDCGDDAMGEGLAIDGSERNCRGKSMLLGLEFVMVAMDEAKTGCAGGTTPECQFRLTNQSK